MKVIEKQHGNTTREYNIVGPKRETVEKFWQHLVDTGVIKSYEIKEG